MEVLLEIFVLLDPDLKRGIGLLDLLPSPGMYLIYLSLPLLLLALNLLIKPLNLLVLRLYITIQKLNSFVRILICFL